jgi:hypothetical protein
LLSFAVILGVREVRRLGKSGSSLFSEGNAGKRRATGDHIALRVAAVLGEESL